MMKTFNGYEFEVIDGRLRATKDGIAQDFHVQPLSCIRVTGEVCTRQLSGRWAILPLRNRRNCTSPWPVPGAVDAASVRLSRLDADGNAELLGAGTDYTLDANFAGIILSDDAPATYILDYALRYQRVDVLAEIDGELRLFHGAETLVSPPWPRLPGGWRAVARVHLRFTDTLAASALYPVQDETHARLINYPVKTDTAARMPGDTLPEAMGCDAESPLWTDVIDYASHIYASDEARARLRKTFDETETLNWVYFGDSVTQGGDVSPAWRWTERFARHLEAVAPAKRLTFFNAAIGGTNSTFGRERFSRDVLAHKPDVVTILFALNDKSMSDETFLSNHLYFIEQLRASGTEPILFTSNMNTGIWMEGLDHAQQRIVDFACEHDLICLDAYGIWKQLPEYAVPYESLLSNGINHPDDVAAGIYSGLLQELFA